MRGPLEGIFSSPRPPYPLIPPPCHATLYAPRPRSPPLEWAHFAFTLPLPPPGHQLPYHDSCLGLSPLTAGRRGRASVWPEAGSGWVSAGLMEWWSSPLSPARPISHHTPPASSTNGASAAAATTATRPAPHTQPLMACPDCSNHRLSSAPSPFRARPNTHPSPPLTRPARAQQPVSTNDSPSHQSARPAPAVLWRRASG